MEDTFRPIIAAVFVTILFIYLVSTYIKPNTGHKNTDNFLSYIAAQRGQIANVALMVAIVTLFKDYILELVAPE
jgi:hypothetical protein